MNFTETYLKFNKATSFLQGNPDKWDSHQEPFADICYQLDNCWKSATNSQRSAWASELVAQGVNNSVLHYQLYGKAKEMWLKEV